VRGIGNSNIAFRHDYSIVNVNNLGRFESGTQVTPDALVAMGLITKAEGNGLVKILGNGEVNRALTVRAHKFSTSARAKIEAAGGTVEVIPVKVYEKTKRRKDEGKKAPAQRNTEV
jgi:large subunit ribosomal protein L15